MALVRFITKMNKMRFQQKYKLSKLLLVLVILNLVIKFCDVWWVQKVETINVDTTMVLQTHE